MKSYKILKKEFENVLATLEENYTTGKIKSLIDMSRMAIKEDDIETLQYTSSEIYDWVCFNFDSKRQNAKNEWDLILVYQTYLPEIVNDLKSEIILNKCKNNKLLSNNKNSIDIVSRIFDRFHLVSKQLTYRHENRTTIEINDEYDVQDLLHSLLKIYFDDIRDEEWTPSYAGKCSRVDFLLKEEQIVIETKKTRRGLNEKNISDELLCDIARYKSHPNCKTLMCFIYDPDEMIKNPRGIEKDLSKNHDNLNVITKICQK